MLATCPASFFQDPALQRQLGHQPLACTCGAGTGELLHFRLEFGHFVAVYLARRITNQPLLADFQEFFASGGEDAITLWTKDGSNLIATAAL